MGSVYQRKGRKGWFFEYRDARGRTVKNVRTTAATKTEAKRLLVELERKIERQRLGLEAIADDTDWTLGRLIRWWLAERCSDVSRTIETSRLTKNILDHKLAELPLPQVTPEVIGARLREMEKAGASPASIEHVRRKLRAIFNAAAAPDTKIYVAENPAAAVKARAIPKRTYHLLGAEEVPVVLRHIAPKWRAVMAAAIYTGARKGELLSLRKSDVDLRQRLLVIGRSWERDTTKGGHAMVLPIAGPLVPILAAAMDASKGELVFPDSKGRMHPRYVDLVAVLRRALARAGIVEGWDHICRRCKARGAELHTHRHEDSEPRRCPTCDFRLWPRPLPRPVRWHDLRHTTATLLLRDGVSYAIVQRLLRHSSVEVTSGTYAHLVAADLGPALARLPELKVAPIPTNALPAGRDEKKPRNPKRKTAANSGA